MRYFLTPLFAFGLVIQTLTRSRARFAAALLLALTAWTVELIAAAELKSTVELSPAVARVFDPVRLEEVDTVILTAIAEKNCPGAVLWMEQSNITYLKAYGNRALLPKPESRSVDTIFDAASLTKVVATTPCVMKLVERGQLDLEAPVSRYLPRFTGEGRDAVLVRHLLTHTSGFRPGLSRAMPWSGYEQGIGLALTEKPETTPGTQFRYSDINFILLGEIVQRVTGERLDTFARKEIFAPLKMRDTGFLPTPGLRKRIAPTEKVEGTLLRGVVHDPTSRLMGGVTGHAGLFTTAADLARYCRMLLNEGELNGVRLFKAESVGLMTSVHTDTAVLARRGLGWDIDSPYSRPRGRIFPIGSYGHTGFTGTALWIDPFSHTFYIFLSNRVHPDGKGSILSLQIELGTLVAQAIRGFDFEHVPNALPPRSPATNGPGHSSTGAVLNGIDALVRDGFQPLRGLRVGLITNHTGQDRRRRATIDLLSRAPGVTLKALFSPEHGVRGQADEQVSDSRDLTTGLPIYSLYGERRAPTSEQLKGLDVLVFDIQDIGARFYTYIATLGNCLEAASRSGLRFVVLDRVNPVNGIDVQGPVHTNVSTFVAFHSLPLRHGMTVGELARMFCAERGWKVALTVVPVEGWQRSQWYDETGLPWSNPSPNMRSMAGAALYSGLGLLESAVSVGRGTDSPFQVVGAPYVNDLALAATLNSRGLAGVQFMPIHFRPNNSTFKGRDCGGVFIHVMNRLRLDPIAVGVEIARSMQQLYPADFASEKMRTLLTDEPTLAAIRNGTSLAATQAQWEPALEAFKRRRQPFLLYP